MLLSRAVNYAQARRDGEMSPFTVAKAFALERQWVKDNGDKTYGKWKWIAEQVKVQGGGCPRGDGIKKVIAKMEADDEWQPFMAGKRNDCV